MKKKILFLPFLQMQSGHHQVADALMDMLKKRIPDIMLKKIDLLSYMNQPLEKMISTSYLKWIRFSPETYNVFYQNICYSSTQKEHAFKVYKLLFLKTMEKLIAEEKPDAIVCTHSLPSYLLSHLKLKGKCHIPVINVYTDFFINSLWGREGIDVHFLSTQHIKKMLIHQHIPTEKMIVTGIPVHEEILATTQKKQSIEKQKILIAGGSSGLNMLKLAEELRLYTRFDFYVLCGNNRKLYKEISAWELEHIKPLPYISSRTEMNRLYDTVDAIITKPGGVTMSEALRKRLPTFVHSVLPGQEKVNLNYLKEHQLVFELSPNHSLESQLLGVLKNREIMMQWENALNDYLQGIELETPDKMVEVMKSIVYRKEGPFSLSILENETLSSP